MRIRIVGAGAMGRGIAQWAAVGGHTVELADAVQSAVYAAIDDVADMVRRQEQKGRLAGESAAEVLARLLPVPAPDSPGLDVDLVIEAVNEDIAVKTELFTRLEKVFPSDTVFATNTSSLSVTQIAAKLSDPGRLAGLHFFNPVPLMKVVEVVPGLATRRDIPDMLTSLVEGCGHRAVRAADTPGFLINHIGRGLTTEAFALLDESVADVAEIDTIARDVLRLKMGPFELMDLTGLDVSAAVMESVWTGFRYDDRLRPSYRTSNRIAGGLLGRKTGEGFYSYARGAVPVAARSLTGGDARRSVWVVPGGADVDSARAVLSEAGASLEDGPAPGQTSVVLVPTWGTTTAATIRELGLPKERTVGLDPLSLPAERIVLAATPATAPDAARDAAAAFGSGRAVSVVRDTAGSVAQRLLAAIVAIAASLAERSIASPEDIDQAVAIGLGYPYGPLAWGDAVGVERIAALQEALWASTGDVRYRPSHWVTERAQLGLTLTNPAVDFTDL